MMCDLLLKLNHANVMEVPGLFEIRLVPKAASDFRIQFGKLAMEILCSFRSNPFLGSEKYTGYVSDFARQSTVMSMLDSLVEIRENSIKFFIETEFCEFSPELEDHFEIFEHIRGFNVTIVTSANTKDETLLLWSGFVIMEPTSKNH
ncbi:hypothetical protein ZWY2020_053804 [Hordeum vulgare]|nr:hypothetical protein ZWY2020_053804 [Hordeum vulgare]